MANVNSSTPLFHQRIYDVLVRTCDATDDESNRLQWDSFWLRSNDPDEYRFIGALGFGGKFWRGRSEWHVSCYPEDRNPERDERIKRANHALEVLRGQWLDDAVGVLEG